MRNRNLCLILLIATLAIPIISCKKEQTQKSAVNEGFIEYRLEFQGDSLKQGIAQFLPKKMKLYFKDNNTRNTLSDLAGMVEFTHIKHHEKGTYTTLVDVFNNQYKYVEQNQGTSIFFRSRPDLKMEPTGDSIEIAGYNCRKIMVTYTNDHQREENFPIYVTRQIDIEGFTDSTPYQGIDGVLLEFQLEIYQMPVKMTATRVVSRKISSRDFKIPAGYKKVNKQTMQKIIRLLK